MMNEKLANALNTQMVYELYSAYIYLGLAARLEKMKLPGMARWMRIQADEELIHADIFYAYLISQEHDVELDAMEKPDFSAIKTPIDSFRAALAHEESVTERINKEMAIALECGHFATVAFLNFFVTEQVEEERNPREIIEKLERAGNDERALLFLDAALAVRAPATRPAGAPAGSVTP